VIRTGPRNLLTDVAGLGVGNAESEAARSGVTVVLADQPATFAIDVRGGAPLTRGAEAFGPGRLVDAADAIFLAGGSAFGLDAGGGVMAWLAERGRGLAFGGTRVPIVAGAILFDLTHGGDKAWGLTPPYFGLGIEAAAKAGPMFALGNAGAGLGAWAGGLKGGLGSASAVVDLDGEPFTVGALVAVNALGSAVMPGQATFWAWDLEQAGELGGQPPPRPLAPGELEVVLPEPPTPNTTIAVVATDAILRQSDAQRIAMMAQSGLARALRPVHSPLDGDAVMVLATGVRDLVADPLALTRLGTLAADTLARAVARGVYEAADLGDMRAYRSVHGAALGTG
jgi:L-aminopeptidase/D-esterase-like protein